MKENENEKSHRNNHELQHGRLHRGWHDDRWGGIMTNAQVQIETVDVPEGLLNWYGEPPTPETVHLYLDPEANDGEGLLSCEADSGHGGMSASVWHGRMRRFVVPLLSAHGANALMASREVQALAARIVAGYSHDHDGSNHVGMVDEDAADAEEALHYFCRDWDRGMLDVGDVKNPIVTLTPDNMGDCDEGDFNSYISYVDRHIDDLCGFAVEIESLRFGEGGDDNTVTRATDEQEATIHQVLADLWGNWCEAGTTFADLQRRCQGGIVRNDRGNGSAGAVYLGERIDDNDTLDQSITFVREDEDPDAWRLAREAFADLGFEGEPEFVAVGENLFHGGNANASSHQAVYCA